MSSINNTTENKITCECGSVISIKGLTRHYKTAKHMSYVKRTEVDSSSDSSSDSDSDSGNSVCEPIETIEQKVKELDAQYCQRTPVIKYNTKYNSKRAPAVLSVTDSDSDSEDEPLVDIYNKVQQEKRTSPKPKAPVEDTPATIITVDQVIDIVRENPGLKAKAIAKLLGLRIKAPAINRGLINRKFGYGHEGLFEKSWPGLFGISELVRDPKKFTWTLA
jgi:hypothetical protein